MADFTDCRIEDLNVGLPVRTGLPQTQRGPGARVCQLFLEGDPRCPERQRNR